MGIFKSNQELQGQSQLQIKKHFNQANEKGFLLVSLLALLPLVVSLCLLLVSFTHYSYVHIQALNLCRKHLLIGQDKIRYQMKKLMKLNTKAKKLRKEHQRALARLAASANPAVFAINLSKLQAVRSRQKFFAAIQKRHIFLAQLKSKLQKNLLIRKIKQLEPGALVDVKEFPFALSAKPKLSLTPSYTPKLNFSSEQSVRASWSIHNVGDQFYKSLNNIVKPQAINAYCGATIKQGYSWTSILIKKGKL